MEYLQYFDLNFGSAKLDKVLNLIINGIPSIHEKTKDAYVRKVCVLNLIINGIPSIQCKGGISEIKSFVLNLIINGIPSIL